MTRRFSLTGRLSRTIAALSIATGVSVLLAGCIGIPNSGAVTTGIKIQAEGGEIGAVLIPEGPTPDATQRQILTGFISAFTGSQDNYAVAREFLTSDLKKTWDPTQSVLVRTGPTHIEATASQTMTYSINTIAEVDSAGTYTQSQESDPQTLTFQLKKENGQWRISNAPQGIVLLDSTFASIFSEQSVYFLDPTGKRLVPDRRSFPAGSQAVRIVSALLAGPTASLKGAVISAFPKGTKLTSPIIPVNDGVAQIDLSSAVLNTRGPDRSLMRAQLMQSLSNVPNITDVSISSGSTSLDLSGSGAAISSRDPQVDSRPLVFQNGDFGFYETSKLTPIPELSAKIVALKPTSVTLGSTGNSAVVGTATGVFGVLGGDTPPQLLDNRPGLIAPSLDEDGYAWTVPAADPNAIRVTDLSGKTHDFDPLLPQDSQIVSLEVSRDGARVAILLDTDAGPRLIVSAIVRSSAENELPTSLVPIPILDTTSGVGTALDATWVDELSVAILSTAGGQPVVQLYQLGGQRTSLGRPLASAVEIVGGNAGTTGLRVLGSDGTIQDLRGSDWTDSTVKASFIAVQR